MERFATPEAWVFISIMAALILSLFAVLTILERRVRQRDQRSAWERELEAMRRLVDERRKDER